MPKIMIIDDEQNILKSLNRLLKSHFNWKIESYTNPQEAIQQATDNKYDIFISDYRMPDMDGVSLLCKIKSLQPLSVRILLSGQTDMESLTCAVNEAEIYKFINKPWNDETLIALLEQSLEHRFEILENKVLSDQLRR